jgi:hypothetical protein
VVEHLLYKMGSPEFKSYFHQKKERNYLEKFKRYREVERTYKWIQQLSVCLLCLFYLSVYTFCYMRLYL